MNVQTTGTLARLLLVCLCCTAVYAGLERRAPPAAAVSAGGAVAQSVDALSWRLSADAYWTRENATRRLIAIGRKDTDHRNLVRSAMNRRRRNRDPEVSQRALRVLNALAPPPIPPRNVDALTRAT